MATQTISKTTVEVVPQNGVVPQDEVNTIAEACINNSVFATEEQLINLYRILCTVQNKPEYTDRGVCANVSYILEDWYGYSYDAIAHKEIMRELILSWKHYSGCESFPVPSGYKSVSAGEAYYLANNMFDKTTKYGKLRHQYINHLKKELRNALKVLKNG